MSLQTHPAIPLYQSTLAQLKAQGHVTEAQTRRAFGRLLERICEERGFLFVEEYPVGKNGRKKVDGAIRDNYSSLGYWEAKDEKDALEIEIKNPSRSIIRLTTRFSRTRNAPCCGKTTNRSANST